jgi:hypothetical protein
VVDVGSAATMTSAAIANAEKAAESVVRVAERLSEALKGSFKIHSEEITVRCPDNVEAVSIALEVKSGLIDPKIRFPFGVPRRVKLRPLTGLQSASQAVVATADGFELNPKEMHPDQIYILDVEYELEEPHDLDALVERTSAREVPKGHTTEFWMQAALKHPKVLRTKYGRVDFRDLDFSVDVGISEQVKLVIPGSFRHELDLAAQLIAERNPHAKFQLGRRHALAMKSRGKGLDTAQLLGELQDLFLPATFASFLEVTDDFHYSSCYRGADFYEIPFPTWPRSMRVLSRTDLTLEHPASNGFLRYKRSDFLQRVAKVLKLDIPDVPEA